MPGLRGFKTGLLALSLFGCTAQAVPPLPVHVGGRVIRNTDGSLTFGWPAVYIEGRFRGTGVSVVVETETDRLRLLIDGVQRGILEPGSNKLTVSGLPSGNHFIRLEKLSESQTGGTRFIGFYPSDGSKPLPAPSESRLEIEYVGDSHSVGYGDLSTSRDCTGQQVHDLTDSQQAFGPLLARRLGADYRVIAYSGRGIVRNYNGGPGEGLPSLYPRMKPDDSADLESEPGNWRPQLIVINLGTNDFSTPLHAGEAWANDAALHADYRARYAAFAHMLMAKQPQAHLVLMGGDAFQGDVEQVAATLNADAPGRVLTLAVGPMEHTACHYHPSLKDQKMMADSLQALLDRHPDIWGGTGH
jgi:lysophospholipase L1-like esterase